MNRFDDDAAGKPEIRVFDVVNAEVLRAGDGVKVAPLRGEIALVGVDERAELAIEKRETVGRDRLHLGDARVDLRVARAQIAQQRNAARELGAGGTRNERQIDIAYRRRQLRERYAVLVDIRDPATDVDERD